MKRTLLALTFGAMFALLAGCSTTSQNQMQTPADTPSHAPAGAPNVCIKENLSCDRGYTSVCNISADGCEKCECRPKNQQKPKPEPRKSVKDGVSPYSN